MPVPMEEMRIETPKDLETLARAVLARVPEQHDRATVFALHGELGVGKTAFTQALASVLGVHEVVPSPTFVVMRLYEIPAHPQFRQLVHIDAYRIGDENEAAVIGLPALLSDPANLICIEWPDKIKSYIPDDALHMEFSFAHVYGDGDIRHVMYGYRNEIEEPHEGVEREIDT
jgi:tRNA threonylcarbamoyladenosine biosynthesis protein TsaE